MVGGLLSADVSGLHRIYAANLAGSALGCVIVLPLLAWVGGEGALLASAAMGLLAAVPPQFDVSTGIPSTAVFGDASISTTGKEIPTELLEPMAEA